MTNSALKHETIPEEAELARPPRHPLSKQVGRIYFSELPPPIYAPHPPSLGDGFLTLEKMKIEMQVFPLFILL